MSVYQILGSRTYRFRSGVLRKSRGSLGFKPQGSSKLYSGRISAHMLAVSSKARSPQQLLVTSSKARCPQQRLCSQQQYVKAEPQGPEKRRLTQKRSERPARTLETERVCNHCEAKGRKDPPVLDSKGLCGRQVQQVLRGYAGETLCNQYSSMAWRNQVKQIEA